MQGKKETQVWLLTLYLPCHRVPSASSLLCRLGSSRCEGSKPWLDAEYAATMKWDFSSTTDLQSGHLEDGAVHLIGLSFLIQQAVGTAAQAAVQWSCCDRGVARSVAGASCADTQPSRTHTHTLRMKRYNLAQSQVVKNQKAAELGGAKRDQTQICSEEKIPSGPISHLK